MDYAYICAVLKGGINFRREGANLGGGGDLLGHRNTATSRLRISTCTSERSDEHNFRCHYTGRRPAESSDTDCYW
jgi:hypothetical protein